LKGQQEAEVVHQQDDLFQRKIN